jgi:hypothetical protein
MLYMRSVAVIVTLIVSALTLSADNYETNPIRERYLWNGLGISEPAVSQHPFRNFQHR